MLVEGLDRKRRNCSGRSRCGRVVNIAGELDVAPGTLVNVRIERGFPNSLLGRRQEKTEEKTEEKTAAKISSKVIEAGATGAAQPLESQF